jgi:ABC-type multidrug transport system fused ATPase/permease subunit
MDEVPLKKAWILLDKRERRNALIVLAVVVMSALSTAVMIGSILPFLTVLAEPSKISTVPQLNWIYETFGFGSDYSFLVALGVATLGVIFANNALGLARVYVITRYSAMRVHALSRKLLALYLGQSYEFFLDRHTDDMSTRILSEVEQMVGSFLQPVAEVVASSLTIIAIVGLLVWIEPFVAIGGIVVFGGTYFVLYWVLRERLSGLGTRRVEANRKRFVNAKEVLGGIKEVKLHGHEDTYLHRFDESSYNTMRPQLLASLFGQAPRYFIEVLAFGGLVVLCILLLDPVAYGSGSSALGDFLPTIGVVAFAAQRMMPEVSKLYASFAKMRVGVAALDTIYSDVVAAKKTSGVAKSAPEPLGLRSQLRLEKVNYRYPNAHVDSLSEISLSIGAGERIGIVGGTGSGKTTVADLILGLLMPTDGQIIVDGTAISDENRRRWQRTVAYVPQEIFLVDSTVAENIAFGVQSRNIDWPRIESVARAAQLYGFVQHDLPQGFETRIGERGVRLSGGQRQRIGIARALYLGADLIVFDEATSALDNMTERDVMSSIESLPGTKTIVVVAHRLSTIQNCDRIVVLDKGRVAGTGTWDELLQCNPIFKGLTEAA